MAKVVVLGAGVCGLAAGLMLARDGHEVTLLERDPSPVPDSVEAAWESWERGGVAQFHQAHILMARGRHVLDAELPDVRDAVLEAGGVRFDYMRMLPPTVADREPRPGDDRLSTVTARRAVLELALGRAAEAQDGLDVRRGVVVSGLDAEDGRVRGVATDGGDRLRADLVVDAMGRRSKLPQLLGDGVEEDAEDSGFIYYTRYFRGDVPAPRSALNTPFESFSVLTLPGDNGTWSVTLYATAGDRPLKAFRHEAAFAAVVGACPLHRHWLEGEPITGVLAMGGVQDRRRRVDPSRVTGLALVGDAWACTNPSVGRGMSFALSHAALLRRHVGDPEAFAEATERELGPWYDSTVAGDRARLDEMVAAREGGPYSVPADPASRLRAALPVAAGVDGDVFRALIEIANMLTLPQDVFARPGFADRVTAAARARGDGRRPGPGREELLELVSSAGARAAAG
jgi:2-polyprenyl-6-methoxyphenol hydroxylase-like FAD-dependent oxidoreductase